MRRVLVAASACGAISRTCPWVVTVSQGLKPDIECRVLRNAPDQVIWDVEHRFAHVRPRDRDHRLPPADELPDFGTERRDHAVKTSLDLAIT